MTPTLTLPSYPARPINGGPLDKAPPKTGEYFYEPKYNEWRAFAHLPSSTMFNREGKRLSIAHEFKPALKELCCIFHGITSAEWADLGALERRHGLGRGSLILLDFPLIQAPYRARHNHIRMSLGPGRCLLTDKSNEIHRDTVFYAPHADNAGALQLWSDLKAANTKLGCQFYEGVVAKRADSLYPIQLLSPEREFPFWVKHRWRW